MNESFLRGLFRGQDRHQRMKILTLQKVLRISANIMRFYWKSSQIFLLFFIIVYLPFVSTSSAYCDLMILKGSSSVDFKPPRSCLCKLFTKSLLLLRLKDLFSEDKTFRQSLNHPQDNIHHHRSEVPTN